MTSPFRPVRVMSASNRSFLSLNSNFFVTLVNVAINILIASLILSTNLSYANAKTSTESLGCPRFTTNYNNEFCYLILSPTWAENYAKSLELCQAFTYDNFVATLLQISPGLDFNELELTEIETTFWVGVQKYGSDFINILSQDSVPESMIGKGLGSCLMLGINSFPTPHQLEETPNNSIVEDGESGDLIRVRRDSETLSLLPSDCSLSLKRSFICGLYPKTQDKFNFIKRSNEQDCGGLKDIGNKCPNYDRDNCAIASDRVQCEATCCELDNNDDYCVGVSDSSLKCPPDMTDIQCERSYDKCQLSCCDWANRQAALQSTTSSSTSTTTTSTSSDSTTSGTGSSSDTSSTTSFSTSSFTTTSTGPCDGLENRLDDEYSCYVRAYIDLECKDNYEKDKCALSCCYALFSPLPEPTTTSSSSTSTTSFTTTSFTTSSTSTSTISTTSSFSTTTTTSPCFGLIDNKARGVCRKRVDEGRCELTGVEVNCPLSCCNDEFGIVTDTTTTSSTTSSTAEFCDKFDDKKSSTFCDKHLPDKCTIPGIYKLCQRSCCDEGYLPSTTLVTTTSTSGCSGLTNSKSDTYCNKHVPGLCDIKGIYNKCAKDCCDAGYVSTPFVSSTSTESPSTTTEDCSLLIDTGKGCGRKARKDLCFTEHVFLKCQQTCCELGLAPTHVTTSSSTEVTSTTSTTTITNIVCDEFSDSGKNCDQRVERGRCKDDFHEERCAHSCCIHDFYGSTASSTISTESTSTVSVLNAECGGLIDEATQLTCLSAIAFDVCFVEVIQEICPYTCCMFNLAVDSDHEDSNEEAALSTEIVNPDACDGLSDDDPSCDCITTFMSGQCPITDTCDMTCCLWKDIITPSRLCFMYENALDHYTCSSLCMSVCSDWCQLNCERTNCLFCDQGASLGTTPSSGDLDTGCEGLGNDLPMHYCAGKVLYNLCDNSTADVGIYDFECELYCCLDYMESVTSAPVVKRIIDEDFITVEDDLGPTEKRKKPKNNEKNEKKRAVSRRSVNEEESEPEPASKDQKKADIVVKEAKEVKDVTPKPEVKVGCLNHLLQNDPDCSDSAPVDGTRVKRNSDSPASLSFIASGAELKGLGLNAVVVMFCLLFNCLLFSLTL